MSVKSKLFWVGYFSAIATAFIIGGNFVYGDHLDHIDRNYYCEDSGYLRATSENIKEFNEINYIECYKEEIIDNKFNEIWDWIVFTEGSDK